MALMSICFSGASCLSQDGHRCQPAFLPSLRANSVTQPQPLPLAPPKNLRSSFRSRPVPQPLRPNRSTSRPRGLTVNSTQAQSPAPSGAPSPPPITPLPYYAPQTLYEPTASSFAPPAAGEWQGTFLLHSHQTTQGEWESAVSWHSRPPSGPLGTAGPTPQQRGPPELTRSPQEIYAYAVKYAVKKSKMSAGRTLLLGILAGAFIAIGALVMCTVGGGSPGLAATNPGLHKWVCGIIGLPFFLSMVILSGSELFTGNTFVMTAGVLERKVTMGDLARNWALSFTGNFIGSLLVAGATFYAGSLPMPSMVDYALNLASYKAHLSFPVAFTRAVLCNWLVCMAVWQAMSSTAMVGKLFGVFLPISSFVALGFEHSIANMFLIPQAILRGANISMEQFLIGNLLPVTLGNIVGGAVLVACAFWYTHVHGAHDAEDDH